MTCVNKKKVQIGNKNQNGDRCLILHLDVEHSGCSNSPRYIQSTWDINFYVSRLSCWLSLFEDKKGMKNSKLFLESL